MPALLLDSTAIQYLNLSTPKLEIPPSLISIMPAMTSIVHMGLFYFSWALVSIAVALVATSSRHLLSSLSYTFIHFLGFLPRIWLRD